MIDIVAEAGRSATPLVKHVIDIDHKHQITTVIADHICIINGQSDWI